MREICVSDVSRVCRNWLCAIRLDGAVQVSLKRVKGAVASRRGAGKNNVGKVQKGDHSMNAGEWRWGLVFVVCVRWIVKSQ